MKNEKNYVGFLIHKIWQILKRFARALSWAQTSYFWRVSTYQGPKGMPVQEISVQNKDKQPKNLKKIKKKFIEFLELSDKNKFWKKNSVVKEKYH